MRRAPALIAIAACLCGCSGGHGGSDGGTTAPPSSTLPRSGTVTFTDDRVYTVAPLGRLLRLPDITVRVDGVAWTRSVNSVFKPPGTHTYGVVTLTVRNLTHATQRIGTTQIWLRDAAGNPHLVAAGARVPKNLLTLPIPAGRSVTGTLAFPAPRRETGYLLVYQFADARAIAKATHVGLLRYG